MSRQGGGASRRHHSMSSRPPGSSPVTCAVALDISQRGPEMARFQDASEEAILPEMAGAAGAHVVILRVPPMYAPQKDAERVLAFGYRDQMNVVRHQTEGQHAVLLRLSRQQDRASVLEQHGIGRKPERDAAVLLGRRRHAGLVRGGLQLYL